MTEYKRMTIKNEDGTYSIVGGQLDEVVKKRNEQEPKPLIEQIEGTQWLVDFVDKFACAERNALLCCQKLGEIEDKIEQGLMVELPRKVNDKGWVVIQTSNSYFPFYIKAVRISEIRITDDNEIYYEVMGDGRDVLVCETDEFSLTKAEAETKLAELREKNK